jgi:hypothetical protein
MRHNPTSQTSLLLSISHLVETLGQLLYPTTPLPSQKTLPHLPDALRPIAPVRGDLARGDGLRGDLERLEGDLKNVGDDLRRLLATHAPPNNK